MIHIVFLRGINVGGQKKILMADLKKLLNQSGLKGVQTYIQSGNFLVDSEEDDPAPLIRQVLKDGYGWDISVFCCRPEQLEHYLDTFPFGQSEPDIRENRTFLTLFDTEPEEKKDLNKFVNPGEKLVYSEKALWMYCPDGYGKSKLSNNFIEKKLNVTATTRNLKTIKTMIRMAEEQSRDG